MQVYSIATTPTRLFQTVHDHNNEINAGRTSIENQRNYDVRNGVAPSGVPYVMLLTKDYSYVVMISGRDRT
jgi:hypothetical protein